MTTTIYYRPTDAPAFRRLLSALRDPIGYQLDELATAYPTAAPEDRPEMIEQMAELLSMDPRTVDEIAQDEFTQEVNETRRTDYPY